jgi:hypothetical protein
MVRHVRRTLWSAMLLMCFGSAMLESPDWKLSQVNCEGQEANLHSILIEMEDTAPSPPLPARICISIFLMFKTGQDSNLLTGQCAQEESWTHSFSK